MKFNWFVVQALTGQEQKVCKTVAAEMKLKGLSEYFGEVLMPTERVATVRNGKKSTIVKKLFPGYVFIEMALYNDDRQLNVDVWTFIKSIQGVIGFLGNDKKPIPMSKKDIDEVRGAMTASSEVTPKPEIVFEPGESIRIKDGPFENFSGIVQEVDTMKGRLKVLVNIFGRETPADLEYWQVEREESQPAASSAATPSSAV